jgi:DNA-binding response OmpR family regulator
VHLADSGTAAIAVLSNSLRPEAMVLDLKLGDMTGYDVLRWTRAQSSIVPTAVITAFRGEFNPDEAIALGARAYVDQPLGIEDFLQLVDNLLRHPPRTTILHGCTCVSWLAIQRPSNAWRACSSNRFPDDCSARFRACLGTSL